MNSIKKLLKKIVPKFVFKIYHLILAYVGSAIYGFPTREMIVIGIVGTRGKTTVGNLIWSCLTSAGYKVGLTGTANIRIGDDHKLNPYHMTMPGRFKLQKILGQMRSAGCQFVIIETPSEGVEQWRHKGIFYDAAVLTTLYPEYLEVHGWDFERCKQMDEVIFESLYKQPKKKLNKNFVKKIIVVNDDAEDKDRFLRHKADIKVTYGVKNNADVKAEKINTKGDISFTVSGIEYKLGMPGEYNISNALAAIATCLSFNVGSEDIKKGLKMKYIPGRVERIDEGQKFNVFVDYAHDAVSLESVLKALGDMQTNSKSKLIVVFGGQGGGRDVKKLPIMGEVSAKLADYVFLTTDDPFDDDPTKISEVIAKGAEENGKKRNENLFLIEDRKNAIYKALSLACEGDTVLIAGKGAEQSMMIKGGKIPWDDRVVVRENLQKLGGNIE